MGKFIPKVVTGSKSPALSSCHFVYSRVAFSEELGEPLRNTFPGIAVGKSIGVWSRSWRNPDFTVTALLVQMGTDDYEWVAYKTRRTGVRNWIARAYSLDEMLIKLQTQLILESIVQGQAA